MPVYIENNGDYAEVNIGDRVWHKYRGWGTVSPVEADNCDPGSVVLDLDDGDTVEVSIHLLRMKEG